MNRSIRNYLAPRMLATTAAVVTVVVIVDGFILGDWDHVPDLVFYVAWTSGMHWLWDIREAFPLERSQ